MTDIAEHIFRVYDIRGKYPEELSEAVARQIALAYCAVFPNAQKIAIAYDTRPSSPALAHAIQEALLEQGKQVMDLGLAPDPLFYFAMHFYGYDGGFMVSGSHSVGSVNGLSMSVAKEGVLQDVIQEDLNKVFSVARQSKKLEKKTLGNIAKVSPLQDYLLYVAKRIDIKRPLRLVIDSGNGAMGFFPQKMFEQLGCTVTTLYGEYDGTFPHHAADPYQEENLRDLQEAVAKEHADAGFAYDADGDRVALIDNAGRVVSGDNALFLLAKQALEKHKGPVVHDVRVSQSFVDEMQRMGVQTHFAVSHHNAIIEKVKETNAVFGGEVTLHFVFPKDYYLVDDALFASLKLAEVVSKHEDIAEFVDMLPQYVASKEVFVEIPDKTKYQIIENLKEVLRKKNYEFVDIDGARIHFEKGWALARAANTSAHIKCRFEGITQKDLHDITQKALALFQESGIVFTKEQLIELER
jgi:phosphomannomutase / phosphoglucomutase